MAVITPTITTGDVGDFNSYLKQVVSFADGVHIDFADGDFAPTKLVPIKDAKLGEGIINHVHVMYQKPLEHVEKLIVLGADLVILHAESEHIREALERLQESGVRTGIALLPDTSLKDLRTLEIDDLFDHVLVFGGRLGYQGSEADLAQLDKVRAIRQAYPDAEIGWDGGVDSDNIRHIADAGVDVINVGGFVHGADDPQKAYDTLVSLVQS